MSRSFSVIETSVSGISGRTSTAAKLVCRRALASNGLIRTRRCTPRSQDMYPVAYGPFTRSVMLRMPAPSPSVRASSSTS